jgi:hypothetical protein
MALVRCDWSRLFFSFSGHLFNTDPTRAGLGIDTGQCLVCYLVVLDQDNK